MSSAVRKSPVAGTTAGHQSELLRASGLSSEDLLKVYGYLRTTRDFENRILSLYQQGQIVGGAYSGNGNEATSVGTAFALDRGDYIFPMHRDVGAHIVRGQSLLNLMLQHLGRGDSLTRGRDGTSHYTDRSLRIYGNISHLGAMVPVACGVALACKLKKEKSVVMTYIGDGGSNVGEVHEGLAMASVMKLPFILIVENNQYAYSTPAVKQFVVEKLSSRAAGYGIPGVTLDGTDVLEVYRVTNEAVNRARDGKGPSLIECVTMRMHGHAAHDTAWYVPEQLLAQWKRKDPIEGFEKLLLAEGILDSGKKKVIESDIQKRLESAVREAESRPYPPGEDALKDVYA